MTPQSKNEIVIMPLLKKLLIELGDSGISYCHWKSNIDLDKSFTGRGDLDLLIDRRHSSSFNQIILRLGFKRGVVGYERQFPGIEDYLGWDRESDFLIHLHVHYQMVLGASYLKSVHLPIEQIFLSNRKEQIPIMISAPECELLVFVLRSILKTRISDFVMGRKCSNRTVEELDFLTEKVVAENLADILSLSHISVALFEESTAALRSRSSWRMLLTKRKLERGLRVFQRYGYFIRFMRPFLGRWKDRCRHRFFGGSQGEKPSAGGMIVAVVGSDGSGKSSLVSELHKWLGRNYSVEAYHLGRPGTSPLSYAMFRVAGLLGRLSAWSGSGRSGFLAAVSLVLGQAALARGRLQVYSRIRRSVGQGRIAIVDRFPLRGVNMDSMSSAAQYLESNNFILRWLAQKTEKHYQVFTDPDVLLVLQVSLEVAAGRRPEDSQQYLMGRIEAVNTIKSGDNVLELNAEKEHDKVIKEAKEFVWKWL